MKTLRNPYIDTPPEVAPSYDRRTGDRIALRIPVRVFTYGPAGDRSEEAICTDLGEGGIALETLAELNVGEIVVIEFQLKGEAPYRCHARLTYRFRTRYGGYFLGAH